MYGFGRLQRTISGGSATTIGVGNADGSRSTAGFPLHNVDLGNTVYHVKESSFMFLDSPNTTTSTNYKVQCKTHVGSADVHINYPNNNDNASYIGRFSSNIIAMEVTP